MIKESGRVVAVDEVCLWVETIQRSACASCSAKNACGQSVMGKMYDGRRSQIRLSLAGFEHESFAVDDQVEIGIPEEALMQGVFWVYILPLLGLFSGGVAAIQCFGPGDLQAIIGAALGFVLSLLAVRRFLSKSRHACAFAPVLLGKSVADVNVVRIVSSVGH